MLRFTVVFAYRPVFEGGGDKWPKLHHIIITSLLLSQVSAQFIFVDLEEESSMCASYLKKNRFLPTFFHTLIVIIAVDNIRDFFVKAKYN